MRCWPVRMKRRSANLAHCLQSIHPRSTPLQKAEKEESSMNAFQAVARRASSGRSHGRRRAVASSAVSVLLLAACHMITNVTPNPAVSGATITITGSNFGATQGASQVLYDGVALAVVAWSNTSIAATLPAGKVSGTYTLSLIVNGETKSIPHTIANPPGMSFVPGGAFQMGSTRGPDVGPIHTVTLDAFWMDTAEVTVLGYGTCVAAGACTTPHSDGGVSVCNWEAAGAGNDPITCVDWNQAASYCAWAGKRLPTEAEWEKAARGTDARTYPWGEATPTCAYAVFDVNGASDGCGTGSTWPVGAKPAGDSPYGLHDMAGNAEEWVADWYSATYYSVSPPANPTGPSSGSDKVLRGGNWYLDAAYLDTTYRYHLAPSSWLPSTGFRCASDG